MNPKQILEAIGILAKAPAAEVAKILQDSALDKAAQDLTHSEMVESRWEEGHMHEHISREVIRTGPEQKASGDGAEKMIRDYSNVATQQAGIMQQAESLARLIAPIAASSKAQTAAVTALIENVKSLNVTLAALVTAKAEGEDKMVEEDDEDEKETKEMAAEKAKSLVARAKILLTKAKKAEGDAMMVEDDEEEEKACKKKAKAFRKQAAVLLGKARTAAFVAGDRETRKSIAQIAAKSDITVVEDDEDEDDDEKEKAKAAAEKAKGHDAAGNQADFSNKDGNQDSTAVKAVSEMSGKVEEALKGFGMLSMELKDMMNVVSGRSKGTGAVPEFTKSAVDPTLALVNKIEELEDAGQLSDTDAFAARDIVSKMTAARAGQLDASIVHDRIAKSTLPVQMLFKAATTAAA
jgi:hypothetical protein